MIFNKTINKERLKKEIEDSDISASIKSIISSGNSCDIEFKVTLPQDDEDTLVLVVNNHKPLPLENVDTSVSARQIRTAMVLSGMSIATTEAAIDSLPEPTKTVARIAWDHSNLYYRDNKLVVALAPTVGLSVSQLDDLWALAKTL